jgi:hypothetical protein
MNLSTESAVESVDSSPDRRRTSRFPVQEEVSYRLLHPNSRDTTVNGIGKTLNFGSGGILFTTQEKLPVGRMVELSVDWPARLNGTCRLKFVATGRVVRSEVTKAAVRIERYQFRTRATTPLNTAVNIGV